MTLQSLKKHCTCMLKVNLALLVEEHFDKGRNIVTDFTSDDLNYWNTLCEGICTFETCESTEKFRKLQSVHKKMSNDHFHNWLCLNLGIIESIY